MSDLWSFQRNHYDRHVRLDVPTEVALVQREQGAAAPLKKFHNRIKKQLIYRFAFNCDSLLDLCCGRGGDIFKWNDAQIKYVKGLDISPAEIEEARRRFAEFQGRHPGSPLQAEFEAEENLGAGEVVARQDYQFDIVTCMFAIHYFFLSETSAKWFLYNVSQNLKYGGYFVGTVPDGKRVLQNLNQRSEFISPMLQLTKRWQGAPNCFGSAFSCAITDTVTEGHGDSRGSYEYLVFFNVLTQLAERYELMLVDRYDDPQMDDLFDQEDFDKPFKHFRPQFPGSDPSLETASALYTAFVFQKLPRGSGQVPQAPELPPRLQETHRRPRPAPPSQPWDPAGRGLHEGNGHDRDFGRPRGGRGRRGGFQGNGHHYDNAGYGQPQGYDQGWQQQTGGGEWYGGFGDGPGPSHGGYHHQGHSQYPSQHGRHSSGPPQQHDDHWGHHTDMQGPPTKRHRGPQPDNHRHPPGGHGHPAFSDDAPHPGYHGASHDHGRSAHGSRLAVDGMGGAAGHGSGASHDHGFDLAPDYASDEHPEAQEQGQKEEPALGRQDGHAQAALPTARTHSPRPSPPDDGREHGLTRPPGHAEAKLSQSVAAIDTSQRSMLPQHNDAHDTALDSPHSPQPQHNHAHGEAQHSSHIEPPHQPDPHDTDNHDSLPADPSPGGDL